jgi:hypothetical protein
MHSDLIEKIIARRLGTLADQPAEEPYDWAEFQRRRDGASSTRGVGPTPAAPSRLALMATAAVAVVLVSAVALVHLRRQPIAPAAPVSAAARLNVTDREEQARTRAIEGWLAGLPPDPVVVRVGTHAAVTSLEDQIAALDDLMTAERAAGAQSDRLGALERQRAQLLSSLAQVRYAEMLASTSP